MQPADKKNEIAELAERARQGDEAALDRLLAEIEPTVQRFGRKLCRHDEDAEDVTQDTLIALTEHLGDLENRAALTSWVFALARSACVRKRRGRANAPHASAFDVPESADAAPSPEDRAALREETDKLARAIADLPRVDRDVLFLRDLDGRPASEAATELGISVDAVKSRLHRAREALRARFGEEP